MLETANTKNKTKKIPLVKGIPFIGSTFEMAKDPAAFFVRAYRDYGPVYQVNVFGRKQDPNGAYAAVIPKFVSQFMRGESPVINGNGDFSRDFTYIDNVIQANVLSMITENEEAINTVYNVAFGERNTLNDLIDCLKESLTVYDPKIKDIQIKYGPNRAGDIPHSLASIDKAKNLLNYNPQYSLKQGLQEAVKWYWNNL